MQVRLRLRRWKGGRKRGESETGKNSDQADAAKQARSAERAGRGNDTTPQDAHIRRDLPAVFVFFAASFDWFTHLQLYQLRGIRFLHRGSQRLVLHPTVLLAKMLVKRRHVAFFDCSHERVLCSYFIFLCRCWACQHELHLRKLKTRTNQHPRVLCLLRHFHRWLSILSGCGSGYKKG